MQPGFDATGITLDIPVDLLDKTPGAPFALFKVRVGNDRELVEQMMKNDPRIAWVEDDIDMTTTETDVQGGSKGGSIPVVWSNDNSYSENSAMLSQIGWYGGKLGRTFRPVKVAILDTGLSPFQPTLWKNVVASKNFMDDSTQPYDLPTYIDSNGNGELNDGTGHGSMVAGLVVTMDPKASLIIGRVADSDGNATVWSLISGIAYSVAQGAELINISLGSQTDIPALSDVLDWADEHNVSIVAPAGNTNLNRLTYPAQISKCISIAGVDATDHKSLFSNYSSRVDLSAPSTGVKSAWWDGSMAVWSGTSFAAPLVTGAISSALHLRPALTSDVLRNRANNGGINIDNLNPNYHGQMGLRLNHRLMIKSILGQ